MTQLDDLDRTAAQAFDGYLVQKDLAQKFRGQYPVPTLARWRYMDTATAGGC